MTVERRDYIALDWVANELADTLRQALAALADYLQNRDDVTQLRFCLSHIHQAYGTLRMVEFAGAALLAEEIESTTQALLAERVPEVQRDDALRALEAALARLPVYLEFLQRERRDTPVALLGLINDLRAVRGEPMITESAIFSPRFPSARETAAPVSMPDGELVDVAKKLRQMYQLALLNYLRGKEPRENLNYLAKVCARLAKLSAGCPPEALWQVCIALLEGLLNRSIEPGAAVKALLRQLDGQLKLLTEQGPAALRAEAPPALLKNMLYYVATSGANSRFIGEIKQAYNLVLALPAPDADNEPTLREIRRALTLHLEELAEALPQREGIGLRHAIKRAQDAAALLGLTRAQNVLQDTIRLLRSEQPDTTAMAQALRELMAGLEHDAPLAPPPTLFNDSEEAQEQLDQAFDAILRESRNSLEQAKEAIIEFVATQWRHQCLEDVPELLAGVRGGFALAGLSRAAKVLAACENYVRDELLGERKVPAWQVLDTLADAIASVDYYLERLSEDSDADCEAILDVAEDSVAALSRAAGAAPETIPTQTGAQVIPFPGTMVENADPPTLEPESTFDPEPVPEPETADDGDEEGEEHTQTDPEILAIFIEEAGEVIDEIDETLPVWRTDPTASEPLVILRRAFHTLKGSGRMVGAIAIGELAWSIENMLNRVLDGSLRVDQARVETLAAAATLAPGMVAAFEHGTAFAQQPVQIVMDRAQALAQEQNPALPELGEIGLEAPDEPAVVESAVEPIAETAADADSDSDGDDEGVLLEIFASEALGHIEALEDFLARAGGARVELSDDVQRALHTLKGSAFMADVVPIARIVTPVERLVKELRAARLDADSDILAMLTQSAQLFRAGLEQLNHDPRQSLPGTDEFVHWVEALHYTRLAQIDEEPESSESISPAAMNHFLGETIELLSAVGDDVRLWRESRLEGERQHTLAGTINQVADNAEALNLGPVVELAQALQSLLRQGAEAANPDDEFFALASDAVESLIDMLDRLAANQQPETYPTLLAALQDYDFTVAGTPAEPDDLGVEPAIDTLPADITLLDIPVLDDVVEYDFAPKTPVSAEPDREQPGAPLPEVQDEWSIPVDADAELVAAAPETVSEPHQGPNFRAYEEIARIIGESEEEPDGEADLELIDSTSQPEQAGTDSSADAEVAELIDEWMLGLPDERRVSVEQVDEAPADAETRNDEVWSAAIEPAFGAYLVEEAEAFDAAEPEIVDLGLPSEPVTDDGQREDEEISETAPEALSGGLEDSRVILANNVEPAAELPEIEETTPVAASDDDEVDAEILEIFLDEAGDLLEAIDEAVHGWNGDRDNVLYLDDMQRLLHTLKGGARLAGLKNLGNLSHNFETMLTSAQHQARPVDDAFMGDVQAFQDELIQRVDAVKARGHLADASAGTVDGDIAPEPAAETDVDTAPLVVPSLEALPTPSVEVELLSEPAIVQDETPAVAAPAADRKVVPFQRQQTPVPAREVEDLPEVSSPHSQRRGPQEVIKISAQLLEQLVNLAGETSIARARAEEQVSEFVFALDEMDITVDRLQEQVRRLDLETDAQMLFRQEQVENEGLEGFDPLEFDRYSLLQQLSRSLLESASDLIDIKNTLAEKSRDMETLLVQQSRINTELQEGLMRSRMVPFSRLVPRLRRIVRQVSGELDKQVEFLVDNAEGELDRTVLERIVAPLEHMLRNAIDHGIETTADRIAVGKPLSGQVVLSLAREGGEVVLTLSDDGHGVDLEAVRRKAIDRGLMAPGANLSDHEVMQFILQSGFSTARQVTQISGRGVGMDVVYSEIKQLGGNLEIDSEAGQGTRFRIRLPFTVSMNRALMVNVGGDVYAVPLNTIEGIVRVSPFELEAYYQPDAPLFEYAGQPYLMRYMGSLLRLGDKPNLEGQSMPLPVLLVRGSDHAVAVQVDGLMGSREIVVKTLGPQFGLVQGLSGATVLGDGSVVVILDLLAMIRADAMQLHRDLLLGQEEIHTDRSRPLLVLVVDDSVTVRKVTSRFLERQGMEVLLAKDGVDAITLLQENEQVPDVMLLDIEMPRMDGFEVASRVRHSARLAGLPIIMITSRTGEKHRERAFSLGVNKYLGKPYQEMVLLEAIHELTGTTAPV